MRKTTLLASALVWALLASLLGALQSGCAVAMPFRGPGFERGTGVTAETKEGTVVVALTSAVLDRSKRGPFDRATGDVARSMNDVEGLIGYSFRKEILGKRAWTMTVWEDEQALRRFVSSRRHRDAMSDGGPATLGFRFHSFRISKDEVPVSWSRALELLRDEGSEYADLGD